MGSKIVKQRPHYDQRKNITLGGDLEAQMIQEFNQFDIVWYSPENSEKLEEWKAFTNVNVIKVSKEDVFQVFVGMGTFWNLIIITTGSFAEKSIPKLPLYFPPVDILIYCMDVDYHKKWSEKYRSIAGVFSNPNQIFEYLLGYQKYLIDIPIFSYKIINSEEFSFNYYDSLNNVEFLVNQQNFDLRLNKYEKFCISSLKYYSLVNRKYKNLFVKFSNNFNKIITFFNGETVDYFIKLFYGTTIDFLPDLQYIFSGLPLYENPIKYLNHFFIGLTLVSLYFSKLPYLYGYLNYQEVEILLKENIEINDLRKDYNELHDNHLGFLFNKLCKNKESILEEKIHLKFLHSFLIKFLKLNYKTNSLFEYNEYSKYPTMIKYLMDLDFCLKLFFCNIYEDLENDDYKIKCRAAIGEVDKRITIFNIYCHLSYYKFLALKSISEEDLNTLTETLRIYDFIVIGNEKFFKIIKTIENSIKHRKIPYLSISEVRDYLKSKNNKKYRNFYYFIIIDGKDSKNIYKELYTIKNDFALIISLIVYIRDEKTLINKRPFLIKTHLSIYYAYNPNEIINYINSQDNINCGYYFGNHTKDIVKIIKDIAKKNEIKIPKFEIDGDKKAENNDGWELVDLVPEEMFKKTIINNVGDAFISEQIGLNVHMLFKEKKIQSYFYEHYCKYFFPGIFPELMSNSLNVIIKHFCYAYTLHEDKNSFYFLMNRDLRQGNYIKVDKYLEIISLINEALKLNYMKTYEEEVFRGTVLKTNFIKEKVLVGKSLTNLAFFSASKERKEAEKYLAASEKNVLFIIKAKANNIDIDSEQISKFENEREVLFLPYSKFLIKRVELERFMNKDIYEIELEGLNNENERENIKKQYISFEVQSSL